mgnify:CR=1 FL=1
MRTDQWTISTENWICEYPEEIRKIEISRIDRVDIIRTHKEGNLKSGPSFLCVRDQSYGVILIKEYSKRQISVKALFPKTCLIVMSGGYAKQLTLNGLNTQDAEMIIEVDGNAYPVKNDQNSLMVSRDVNTERISVHLLCRYGVSAFRKEACKRNLPFW